MSALNPVLNSVELNVEIRNFLGGSRISRQRIVEHFSNVDATGQIATINNVEAWVKGCGDRTRLGMGNTLIHELMGSDACNIKNLKKYQKNRKFAELSKQEKEANKSYQQNIDQQIKASFQNPTPSSIEMLCLPPGIYETILRQEILDRMHFIEESENTNARKKENRIAAELNEEAKHLGSHFFRMELRQRGIDNATGALALYLSYEMWTNWRRDSDLPCQIAEWIKNEKCEEKAIENISAIVNRDDAKKPRNGWYKAHAAYMLTILGRPDLANEIVTRYNALHLVRLVGTTHPQLLPGLVSILGDKRHKEEFHYVEKQLILKAGSREKALQMVHYLTLEGENRRDRLLNTAKAAYPSDERSCIIS